LQANLAATLTDLCVSKPAIKTKTLEPNATAAPTPTQNVSKNIGPTLQTGMYRYIQIKSKLSPQNSAAGNKTKINRNNPIDLEYWPITMRIYPPALMKGTNRRQSFFFFAFCKQNN